MSRAYNGVRPKKHYVYGVEQVMALYDVSRNTVSNWIKQGLEPSDDQTPKLFSGFELKRFHDERRERLKSQKLRAGQFKCLTCKAAVFPDLLSIYPLNETANRSGARLIFATCPECEGKVTRILNATGWDIVQTCIETNTRLESIDESKVSLSACIVNHSTLGGDKLRSKNDRVLFEWLKYAGKYDPKTTDAHLSSIRDFEDVCGHVCFRKLKKEYAANYRESLVERSTISGANKLSRATVRHRASHIRLFIDWLTKQKNYGRLDKSMSGYLELSRKHMAQAFQPEPRAFPTMDQAVQMVNLMPSGNLIERRNRCMVAVPFLSGLRADATASLIIHHIKVEEKQVIQDAGTMRTKNGKSLLIDWFPVPEIFETVLTSWLDDLHKLGFRPIDAIFPHATDLKRLSESKIREHPRIEPLSGSSAVGKAFRSASALLDKEFTPHSAKDTLASLRDQICRTPIERKAFSENLGHRHERTTDIHYAKLTNEEHKRIFDSFRNRLDHFDDDKDLMLDYHSHLLVPGTTEFERAAQLAEIWRAKRKIQIRNKSTHQE